MEVKYIYNHSPCFASLLKAKSLSTTALTSPKANAFFEILINYLFADTQMHKKPSTLLRWQSNQLFTRSSCLYSPYKNHPQGVAFLWWALMDYSAYASFTALIAFGDRRAPARLSLVVKPTSRWFELSILTI